MSARLQQGAPDGQAARGAEKKPPESAQKPHWSQIGESTSVLGIQTLCLIYRLLGRGVFRLCALPVVLVHFALNARARAASLEYLRKLHAFTGSAGPQPGLMASLKHFRLFADTLLDRILSFAGQYPAHKVHIERQPILELIEQGKGGVIITAHIGCLELSRALAEEVPECRMTILMHTLHTERYNRMMERMHQNPNLAKILPVHAIDIALASELAQRYAQGEFIVITGDRTPPNSERTQLWPFLGHPARFPIGPYALASTLRSPLLTMACLHKGAGYELKFEILSERVHFNRNTRQAVIEDLVGRYARWLESQAIESPYDWFNFYAFWD